MGVNRVIRRVIFSKTAIAVLVVLVFAIARVHINDYTNLRGRYVRSVKQQKEQLTSVESIMHSNISAADVTSPPPPTRRPFAAGEPVHVLVLAYQRTGSSFFGNMFATNPDALYFYEPLDGVFTHLYGTALGWAVPVEISHDTQGKLRDIPSAEQEMMSEVMMGLYTCQFRELPVEIMGHNFMTTRFASKQPDLAGYRKCMGGQSIAKCNIGHVCPKRMGQNVTEQKLCMKELEKLREPRHVNWHGWEKNASYMSAKFNNTLTMRRLVGLSLNDTNMAEVNNSLQMSQAALPSQRISSNQSSSGSMRNGTQITLKTHLSEAEKTSMVDVYSESRHHQLDKYTGCLNNIQAKVDKCYSSIDPMCHQRDLHAIKTVRLDMGSVEKLLEYLPNLRVIHLLRDPRGVALSRNGVEWSAGTSDKMDIVNVARMYCEVASKDIKKRQELELRFPGAFTKAIYEDFTSAPVETAKQMYAFLNLTLPHSTEEYLNAKTQKRSSSKWQDKLTFHQAFDIHNHCKELFTLTNEPRWLTLG